MPLRQWKLQNAKNHFSEVVDIAMHDGPQEITRRGEHAVVILSFEHYQEMVKPKENWSIFSEILLFMVRI